MWRSETLVFKKQLMDAHAKSLVEAVLPGAMI